MPITKYEEHDRVIYYTSSAKTDYDAKGMVVPDGFVVLKGSRISNSTSNSFKNKGYSKLRENLIANGVIVDRIFTRDYHFDSYPASSGVVRGQVSRGWTDWRTKDGKTLDEIMKLIQCDKQ